MQHITTSTTSLPAMQTETKPDTRATTIGFLCLFVGCVLVGLIPLLGWFIGGPLFLVAFILSIIAMSKNNIGNGIMLLFGTLTMPWLATLIGVLFYASLGAAASSSSTASVHPTPTPKPFVSFKY
jgi:hypothetical protein